MELRRGRTVALDGWHPDDALVDEVLGELAVSRPSAPDLPALSSIYRAWCRRVPSDNALKRIHLASGNPDPLPAATAAEVLETFLETGTGGTCWGTCMGLYGLLEVLGFRTSVGAGPMLGVTPPGAGPAHGCVLVEVGGQLYDIDGYVLCDDPLRLDASVPTRSGAGVLAAEATPVGGSWEVRFRTGHSERRLTYRIDVRTDDPRLCTERWEASRHRSALNHLFFIRRNTADGGVITYARGKLHRLSPGGILGFTMVGADDRDRLLVDEFGLAPHIIEQIPPDEPDARDIP